MEHTEDSSVQAWFTQQGKYSHDILKNISGRDSLFMKFVALDKLQSTSYQGMVLIDSIWFYKKRMAGEPVASLYYRKAGQSEEVLLFNPMSFSQGHTFNIKNFTPSLHGTNITIETAEGGGEVATVRIMNVATKQFYKDSLAPTLYGVSAWINDNSFIYTTHTSFKEDAIEFHLNTKSMLHVVGTDRANDTEIFSAAKYNHLHIAPEDICYVALDQEEKYLMGFLFTAANELRTYYAPVTTIQDKIIPWKLLFKKEDKITNFFTHGKDIYMLTYKDAPNYKITRTNIETPDVNKAITIFNEGKNKISDISGTKNYLIATLTDGINNTMVKYDFKTASYKSVAKELRGQVTVAFSGSKTDSVIIGVTSWSRPFMLYDFNAKTDQYRKSVFDETVNYPGIDNIKVKEVEVSSYDGTMVPLSILYNKNTVLDGNNSCILTGYGCYGYSLSPYFSVMNLELINQGVVLAVAHIRGGGEKGENWHIISRLK
ncbi:MAG TPA: hypothetical protein VFE04_00380, partial [Puia sp.]|nr:hypothetical protein [Puia sp.]